MVKKKPPTWFKILTTYIQVMTVQKYTLITVNAPLDPDCAHIWTLGLAQFVNNCLGGGGLKSQAGCDLLVHFSNCESGFQNNGPLSIT